jgi:hypothetical protein
VRCRHRCGAPSPARIAAGDPLEADVEVVPLDLVDVVVGPDGGAPGGDLAVRADCPVAPELLGPGGAGVAAPLGGPGR